MSSAWCRKKYFPVFFIGLFVMFFLWQGCSEAEKKYDNPVVVIETQVGNIKVELFPGKAPATVAAFLQNIDSGFFRRSSFYRVLRYDNQVTGAPHSYLIQGGIWEANPDLKSRFRPIPHESSKQTGLLHKRGSVSMARNEPGTATSEFFICMEDEPGYDFGGTNNHDGFGYAVFGEIIEGMDIAEKIYKQREHKQRFLPPIVILDIKRFK